MLHTKFRFIWPSAFNGDDFLEINHSETRIACGGVSDWLISKKSSPLKPLYQMNQNLIGSILGRSSIKLLIYFRSVNKHDRHRQFLFLNG
jgi:hypothetical protein